MKRSKSKVLFNVLGFKISWIACAVGAAKGMVYLGPILMLLYIVINSRIFNVERSHVVFLITAAVIGTIVDSLKATTGFITYTGGYAGISWIAPLWITALWLGFAATLDHSLSWLQEKLYIAFTLGAIFGPIA
ncbi:DUF2878 domain-containing protein, partial [candidate division KSB1 bacterium]